MSAGRMQTWSYYSLMVLFLVTATFHGVNGVYNALINMGLTGAKRRIVKVVLLVASAVLLVQGFRTANAWAGIDLLPIL
jgi:succinate dehydrogenase / fumarate reductase membrane anchor subunit